jgi:hypothetical protein
VLKAHVEPYLVDTFWCLDCGAGKTLNTVRGFAYYFSVTVRALRRGEGNLRRQFGFPKLVLTASLLFFAKPALPDSLTLLNGGLSASVLAQLSPFSVLAFDIRGPALFEVNAPGPTPIGPVFMTDGGTPFPNEVLLTNDTATQHLNLTFNPATLVLGASEISINATGSPVGTVTDPELLALENTFKFEFTPTGGTSKDGFILETYGFAAANSIPEPGSFGLLGLGLLSMAAGTRFRRRRRT